MTVKSVMYHGTSHEKFEKILQTGIITDIRYKTHKQSVWLTTDYEIAKKFAYHSLIFNEHPSILIVNTELMKKNGIQFYDTFNQKINWETDDIPVKYILKEIRI